MIANSVIKKYNWKIKVVEMTIYSNNIFLRILYFLQNLSPNLYQKKNEGIS